MEWTEKPWSVVLNARGVVVGILTNARSNDEDYMVKGPIPEELAYLIAAAPDLLAACEACAEKFKVRKQKHDAHDMVKQAIKKARGE